MDIFLKATKTKLRFKSPVGYLTTEDLWSLPLTAPRGTRKANLDDIAKDVAREIKDDDVESFVTKSTASPKNDLRLSILKKIIDEKLNDANKANDAQLKRARKQKLLEAKQSIEDGAVSSMSKEQIDKELKEINDSLDSE